MLRAICCLQNHPVFSCLVLLLVLGFPPALPPAFAQDKLPRPLVSGLKNPESVAVWNGKIYVSTIGEFDKPGDGAILEVRDGKVVPFAAGLDDPKGIVGFQQWLFVADRQRVWRINGQGKAEVYAAAEAFPIPPRFLNDIDVDETGVLYVSDSGNLKGKNGAIFRIDLKKKVTLVTDDRRTPALKIPNGVVMDGMSFLLLLDFESGELHRIRISDGQATRLADGFGGGDGLVWDKFGRLFVSDYKNGKVYGIARPGDKPVLIASGFQAAADICLDPTGKFVLVPDMKAGTLTAIPAVIPGAEVDETPLPLETALAFPELKWTGWDPEPASGKVIPFRPVLLTHAGDGSNRVFVATQQGTIHVFANDQKVKQSAVFLDLRDRVAYNDNTNEEGFLGLAFHPHFKQTGEFFVFYTVKTPKLTNVVSRFRLRKDDPTRADPASEEELLRFTRPFWNHDGGTICFGPDGYLYITHGDGGSANDPFDNGQNLNSVLGKVLRIDVDRKDAGKKYAIPRDNPFVGRPRRSPGNLGLRSAQHLAHGLRSQDRRAVGGRRGPEPLRGNRPDREGRQLRLEPPRGVASLWQQGSGAEPRDDRSDLGIPSRPRQVDHRRQRLPRFAPAGAGGTVRLRRLRHRQALGFAP